jgi:hypothetical protein
MQVRVDLGGDYANLRLQYANLATRDVRLSAARALNRVGVSARQVAAPVIAKELNGALPEPVIRRSIKFRNANGDRLYIDLRAVGGRRIPARLFKPRQTRQGVTIKIGSKTVRIGGAFITRSGAVRVRGPDWSGQFFDQTTLRTKRLQRGSAPDYPIPQIYVPGVPLAFLERAVVKAIEDTAKTRFPIEFSRELESRSRGFVRARS